MADDGILFNIREWVNSGTGKLIVGGLCGAAIVVAVAVVLTRGGPSVGEEDFVTQKVLIIHEGCYTGKVKVRVDQRYPIECPKCKAVEAVVALKCSLCDHVFRAPPANATQFRCPKCRHVFNTENAGGGDMEPPSP